MSSFFAIKLDNSGLEYDDLCVKPTSPNLSTQNQVAKAVRRRIANGGERTWRLEDFRDLPSAAAAKSLSRLTRTGELERLSKGIYYRSRMTVFGKSRPNPAAIQQLAETHAPIFPSGIAAANILGFTTQTAAKIEVATNANSLPRKLVGVESVIHTRRPEAWSKLSKTDAALLDFLRRRGAATELSGAETIRRTLILLAEANRYERLVEIAGTEPPRVRALLGALGEQLGKNEKVLKAIRETLNPLSRFDFGILGELPNARAWLAKDR